MRILVVEDDSQTARFLKQGLEEEGHAVDVATDGEEGSHLCHIYLYDLILLDIQIPKRTGLELSADLRREGIDTPILMLTGRDSTPDVVRGLNAGADDYLTKPFDFDELLARVAALTRRRSGSVSGVLHFGNLQVDRLNRQVRVGHRRVELSPREFRLLEHFMLHPEQVVTRVQLLQQVWDMSFDPETNMIDAHISNLRKKLERYGDPRLLQTIRGAGYALRLGDE
ncbi:MAG: response regulator transcription factor [Gemmatimonadetes bacterium]|nr:response regulator transcription factor [Gemmatimonadota bacterium]